STSFVNPNTGLAGSAYGGLFANASNIGEFNNDEFAVIPEVTMNFGINATKQLNMFVGYNFLHPNKVGRPGAHINPIVDASTVPLSPTYGTFGHIPGVRQIFVQDDFWLMGVNFGMIFKY